MRLHEVEPPFWPETVVPMASVMHALLDRPRSSTGPFLLAIDGRSSSGKSSLAARLAASTQGAAVVHTDDVAWNYSTFGWDGILVSEIIEPLRAGHSIAYRPPGYATRTDPVEIEVSAETSVVVIEGVGSARARLAALVDAVVWVQSDLDLTDERNWHRVAAGEMSPPDYDAWMAEEVPFQAQERSWERADLIVSGTPTANHDPDNELVLLGALRSDVLGVPDQDPR